MLNTVMAALLSVTPTNLSGPTISFVTRDSQKFTVTRTLLQDSQLIQKLEQNGGTSIPIQLPLLDKETFKICLTILKKETITKELSPQLLGNLLLAADVLESAPLKQFVINKVIFFLLMGRISFESVIRLPGLSSQNIQTITEKFLGKLRYNDQLEGANLSLTDLAKSLLTSSIDPAYRVPRRLSGKTLVDHPETIPFITNDSRRFDVPRALLENSGTIHNILEDTKISEPIQLSVIDGKTFEQCLAFLKTESLENDLSPQHLANLMVAADFLDMPSLRLQVAACQTFPELSKKAMKDVVSLMRSVENNGFLDNILVWSDSEADTNIFAIKLARACGLDFIYVNELLDETEDIQTAVAKMRELFSFAHASPRKLLIIFDHATTFLCDRRSLYVDSEINNKRRTLLYTFLSYTGTAAKNFLCTIHCTDPSGLEEAVLSRCYHRIKVAKKEVE